ncbi:hypothetical protein SAMN05216371_8174 [Streptomyces sp. TLI_053]|uniref:hypothetical protein n=1 Tax=Streptomyces sp. TLI_053 TaxID=1855352 RepID=UPI0008796F86|nr:hypothetical protein [Streptomyces sp. TLI_053]SDT83353.1 hypothetical protein SAMN05216371_8174 [Streptomyces sp. TLI_053]
MRRRHVIALAAALTGHLALQLFHTLTDRNTWPYCSYNMFSFHAKGVQTRWHVKLVTDGGLVLGPVSAWGLLPLEFFRVDAIIKKVFLQNVDPDLRTSFCESVLVRLNTRPWRGWDEVKRPPVPPAGQRIVAMELCTVELDLVTTDAQGRPRIRGTRLIHTHDPDRVLSGPGQSGPTDPEDR